ncbi:MAG: phage portal protein [Elusimicrobiales bacterium]|nr:phage portal protein [Elusimicrobiales bacterium]
MSVLKTLSVRLKAAGQVLVGGYVPYGFFPRIIESISGEPVTPRTALQVAAVFACINVLSQDVSTLPLIVYRRTKDGKGKDRTDGEKLYRLLHLQPNSEMSSVTWREVMMIHTLLWSNHYSEIVRDWKGNPVALWPIPNPEWVRFCRKDDNVYTPFYRVTIPGRGVKEMPFENILHIKGMSMDGNLGMETLSLARNVIGQAIAAQNYAGRYFRNGAEPSAILKYPKPLKDDAYKRLLQSYKDQTTGSEQHGMVILENGADWVKTSYSPQDSQLIDTRKNDVIEVCRYFRVPPHKVAALERSTNNNIEQQDLDYYKSTLRPWLVKVEQEMMIRLLPENDDRLIEFMIDGMLRGDYKTRMDGYAVGIQNGIYSPNECRAMENLNPRPGGEVYYQPLNMVDNTGKQETANATQN